MATPLINICFHHDKRLAGAPHPVGDQASIT
jgi:hypothetical protein